MNGFPTLPLLVVIVDLGRFAIGFGEAFWGGCDDVLLSCSQICTKICIIVYNVYIYINPFSMFGQESIDKWL